jgi:hypothetical protein
MVPRTVAQCGRSALILKAAAGKPARATLVLSVQLPLPPKEHNLFIVPARGRPPHCCRQGLCRGMPSIFTHGFHSWFALNPEKIGPGRFSVLIFPVTALY